MKKNEKLSDEEFYKIITGNKKWILRSKSSKLKVGEEMTFSKLDGSSFGLTKKIIITDISEIVEIENFSSYIIASLEII